MNRVLLLFAAGFSIVVALCGCGTVGPPADPVKCAATIARCVAEEASACITITGQPQPQRLRHVPPHGP